MLAAERGNAETDPKKIADFVVGLANTEDVPKRLILAETARAEGGSKVSRTEAIDSVFGWVGDYVTAVGVESGG